MAGARLRRGPDRVDPELLPQLAPEVRVVGHYAATSDFSLLSRPSIRSSKDFSNFFSPNGWAYIVGETILIVLFTYFYTAVTFNPVDQADNLKKYGGFIPGVRPGRPTAEFLDRILARLTFPGALYLAAVAALPTIIIAWTGATQNFHFGGTSLLIVVGVALDTMKQLEAQLMMRNYEGFLK